MVAHLMPFQLEAFGLSDTGLVRQNNEDVWALYPELEFFVLADGMGGHQAGEVASRETVDALHKLILKKIFPIKDVIPLEKLKELMVKAIQHVNQFVYKMGRSDQGLRGMGTTLCTLLFQGRQLVYAHVGDSRIYCLRNDKLEQLTEDDSLLRELVQQGQLNTEQATDFMYKNIITKAIGTERNVVPTVKAREFLSKDLYLMCSDGLSDCMTIEEIESILISVSSTQEAAEILVATANLKGGQDNITVVLVKVEEIDEQSTDAKNLSG